MKDLRQAWQDHLRIAPRARTLDVAEALGVSEAELLSSRIGEDATLLRSDWKALVERLPTLGPVMCLTRNTHVVHERVGPYETVNVRGPMGGVYGEHIDQRLILSRWGRAIAAPVENRRGTLDSLQFFDTEGTAVLKIYARPGTDREAWASLVADLADPDPQPFEPQALAEPPERPDAEVDAEALREAWAAMNDTHQAHPLLRRHRVGRVQALRLLGPDWATPVDPLATLQALLEGAAEDAEPLMVFVGNTGCIQIHSGLVERIVAMEEWLNVLDPDFNLHVRSAGLHQAWIVRKPTDRGLVWSLEVYGDDGSTLVQLFGKRTEAKSQRPSWHARLDALQNTHGIA